MFYRVNLPDGEYINAAAHGQDMALYISKNNMVYKGVLKDFMTLPYMEHSPAPFYHCDEICAYSDGSFLTRKNTYIKYVNPQI